MAQATITSKGQITIPAGVRSDLKIGPGDRITFIKLADGRYEILAATRDITALKGLVKAQTPVSITAMDQAIRRRAARL